MENRLLSSQSTKKVRNSSIEILRIIAMFLIVVSHLSVHGVESVIPLNELKPCFNKYMLESIQFGALSVDIFIIITGYFSVKSTFKVEKLIKLVLQVFFYSIVIFLSLCALGIIDFSVTDLIKYSLPTIFNRYWFFTSYILLYILSPFINKYLNIENRKNHLILIIVLIVIFRYFAIFTAFINKSFVKSTGFTNLIIPYLIGAYLRLYPNNILSRKKNSAIAFIATLIFTFFSVAVINIVSRFVPTLASRYAMAYNKTAVPMLILAASLFTMFNKINIGEKRFINAVSACTFGVYLIHDNDFIRPILWNNIVHASDYVYSKALVLFIPAVAAAIFIVCAAIDFIRQKTIEKPVMAAVNAVCGKIRIKAAELYDKKSHRS